MIKIALCDDCLEERTLLRGLVEEWSENGSRDIKITEFESADSFWFQYDDAKFDIVLLDIEMPGMNGIELAKKLRLSSKLVQIAFITGYFEYISEGYDVEALHYLLKPVKRDKLFDVLDRAIERLETDAKTVLIETQAETALLPIYEIRYIEVIKNYITLHAAKDHTVKMTLKDIERELDDRFLRVGRSFIINLRFVARVTRDEVFLKSGENIPIPRGAYEKINRAIIDMKR